MKLSDSVTKRTPDSAGLRVVLGSPHPQIHAGPADLFTMGDAGIGSPESGPRTPPAGWYADPTDSERLRYWSGTEWTTRVAVPQVLSGEGSATQPKEGSALPVSLGVQDQVASVAVSGEQSRRRFRQRRLGALIGAAVIVLGTVGVIGVTGGLSDDSPATGTTPEGDHVAEADPAGQVSAFCGVVREFAEVMEELRYDDSLALVVHGETLFLEVPRAAPDSINSDMNLIVQIPPDSADPSDEELRSEAAANVDAYVAEECDVRFSFDPIDFSEG